MYIGDIIGTTTNYVWNNPYMHYIKYQFKAMDNTQYILCLNLKYGTGVFKSYDLYKK